MRDGPAGIGGSDDDGADLERAHCHGADAERADAEPARELERLRLENQRLWARLEDHRQAGFALRKAAWACWHALAGRVRAINGAWRNPFGKQPAGFTPHAIHIVGAVEQHRPRIVHALGNAHLGGSTQLVVDLIERLGHRFDQRVLARDVPATAAYAGLPLDEVPAWRGANHARSWLARARPDLLHVHFLGHHHDYDGAEDWRWYHRILEAARALGCPVIENINIPVAPYASDTVRRYVYVSDYVRTRFALAGAPNVTIHPGSDLARFSRAPGDLPPDDCAGMVYRLEGDKLDARAIDVFTEIVRRRSASRALIVGGGHFLPLYRRRVADAGLADRIEFTDYVSYDALPGQYRRLSVFVAPVHTESFGQVAPFAMSMGIPVVGWDVGALAEILGDRSGLAPPGDVGALADLAVALLDDRTRRLERGAELRARAADLFSVERMIERYGALYDELLGAGPAPTP
ncbi:MAG TPA: glycosyltransferase [Gemmatimonadales bacterium]|nr:glycosyltransferase [Gemmatimonadales bacterium]